jgi:hypothetical protein
MIFSGDALFPGGNDYPAEEAGIVSIRVKNQNVSKEITEAIISCLQDGYSSVSWRISLRGN